MIKLTNAILFALFDNNQEIRCTLAVIQIRVKQQAVVATDVEILNALAHLEQDGYVEKNKCDDDKVRWSITSVTFAHLSLAIAAHPDLTLPINHPRRLVCLDQLNLLKQWKDAAKDANEVSSSPQFFSEKNMQNENALMITVKTVTDEAVKAKMDQNYAEGKTKIASLNNLFAIGLQQAHYEFEEDALQGENPRNGTGYYDPLDSAIFLDENGQPVQSTKTVRFLDRETLRRVYILVIYPGMNLIIHDRYRGDSDSFALVCTSNVPGARAAIGMEPAWAEDTMYDFVNACRMFGFEYDRGRNEVYMPRERKQNAFEVGLENAQAVTRRIRKMQGATV